MTLVEARLAKLREYAEPFQMTVDDPLAKNRLVKALRGRGLGCWRCDEFDHAGTPVDLRRAIESLLRFFRRSGGPVFTVGLVDCGTGCWQHSSHAGEGPAEPFDAMDLTLMVETEDSVPGWIPPVRVGRVSACDWADAVLEIGASLKRGYPVDQ
jgi:hypothetical protein